MKLIEKLSEFIEDEIEGARNYAKAALELKDSKPELARIMYNHSLAELQHMNDLHECVVQVIDDYRKDKGEPPTNMRAIYEYLHSQHIDDAAEVRILQSMYSGR